MILLLALTGTGLSVVLSHGAGGGSLLPTAASMVPTPTNTPTLTPSPSPSPTATSNVIVVAPTPTPTATPTPIPTPPGTGLNAQYYIEKSWNSLTTSPSTGTLAASEVDPLIDFNWTQTNRPPSIPWASTYCVQWTGNLVAPLTGTYYLTTITTSQYSTIWVYIGSPSGTPIIDTRPHHVSPDTVSQSLTASQPVPITVNYCDRYNAAGQVQLQWLPPGGTAADIPTSALYPS
jgi:hypothetical protein